MSSIPIKIKGAKKGIRGLIRYDEKTGSSIKFKGSQLGSDILNFGSSTNSKGKMRAYVDKKIKEEKGDKGEKMEKLKKTYSDKY